MNRRNLLIAATVLGLFASSCKKDAFNQRKLTGTWTVQEYKVNNTDLLTDSLSINVDGQTIKTGFSNATIIFEEDGDFTENITYGASSSYTGGYSYPIVPTTTSTSTGLWSCLDSDLLMSFNTSFDPNANSYDYMTFMTSPMNSLFFTGNLYYGRTTTERYDILKVTNSELEMQGVNSVNQIIYIKATKN